MGTAEKITKGKDKGMSKILRKLGHALLVLAMVLGMVGTAFADDDSQTAAASKTVSNVTFEVSNVKKDDKVLLFQLVNYTDNYNSYQFEDGFGRYLQSLSGTTGKTPEKILEENTEGITDLISNYIAACNAVRSDYDLPDANQEVIADASEKVQFSNVEPGYYMILVETSVNNSKIYNALTAFVQVKAQSDGDYVNVSAGGSEVKPESGVYKFAAKSSEGPTAEKKVYDSRKKIWSSTSSASVDGEVSFYVRVNIPAYTGVNDIALTLVDTLSNMEYVDNSAKLYRGAPTELTFSDEIDDTAFGVNAENYGATKANKQNVTFELTYNDIKASVNDTTVYLFYKAKVKGNAAATSQAENSVTLKYQNYGDTAHLTVPSTTNIYLYSFKLRKGQKLGNTFTSLSGAGFTIYKKYTGQNENYTFTDPIDFVKVGEGTTAYYRPAEAGESNTIQEIPADTEFLIKGLDLGDYCVVETTVPTGFYAPTSGWRLTLAGDRGEGDALTSKLMNGSGFAAFVSRTDAALIEASDIHKENGEATNQYDVDLLNSSTPVLPSTGGTGTMMLTIGGVILMILGVAVFMIFGKKVKTEK